MSTETVDREALAKWAHEEGQCRPWEDYAHCDCSAWAARLIDAVDFLDAAAVRHEHGERIVKALRSAAVWPDEQRAAAWAERVTRDLSPPP